MSRIKEFSKVSTVIADGKGSEDNFGIRLETLTWVNRIKDGLIQVDDPIDHIHYIGYSPNLPGDQKWFGATCSDWNGINPDNMVSIGGQELESLLEF